MNEVNMNEVKEKALAVREAAKKRFSTESKNSALIAIADALEKETATILAANQKDLADAKEKGMESAMLDRLTLTEARIQDIAQGVRDVASLPDPVGEEIEAWTRPNGLTIRKVRVPLGVIGMIYEARPNVTVDCAALALKTGNGILLRGSASALRSNQSLVSVMHTALESVGFPKELVMLSEEKSHDAVKEMLRLNGIIDVLIPRGGGGLIRSVIENATVPVIQTGVGNCHIFVDESADPKMTEEIVLNAKTQRPAVCNAAETLLVHEGWIANLPNLLQTLTEKGVTIHGCEKVCAMFAPAVPANERDYTDEYLTLDLCVKIVADVAEAIAHIDQYGTGHTEAILTDNSENAENFLNNVDAACVNLNASTRFTDGFQFGFGAEIGISTQKLHARGPLGLAELTSYKYRVEGTGQVRK